MVSVSRRSPRPSAAQSPERVHGLRPDVLKKSPSFNSTSAPFTPVPSPRRIRQGRRRAAFFDKRPTPDKPWSGHQAPSQPCRWTAKARWARAGRPPLHRTVHARSRGRTEPCRERAGGIGGGGAVLGVVGEGAVAESVERPAVQVLTVRLQSVVRAGHRPSRASSYGEYGASLWCSSTMAGSLTSYTAVRVRVTTAAGSSSPRVR